MQFLVDLSNSETGSSVSSLYRLFMNFINHFFCINNICHECRQLAVVGNVVAVGRCNVTCVNARVPLASGW